MTAMADQIVRCVIDDPDVRVVAVISTALSQEAARRHRCVAGAQVALSRAATTGLLLATMTKGAEQFTLSIAGDGPLGEVSADARGDGTVRAYARHPEVLVPAGPGESARLAPGIGSQGVVRTLRDLGLRQRFSGQSPIVSGEIDADVEHYLRTSEQIESALGCDAAIGDDTKIAAAGGLLVQCLPGEEAAPFVREVSERLRQGALFAALASATDCATDAEALARHLLGDAGADLRVLSRGPVEFRCRCSAKRVLAALSSLPAADLEQMIDEDGGAEVTCDYCREVFRLGAEQLEPLAAAARSRGAS